MRPAVAVADMVAAQRTLVSTRLTGAANLVTLYRVLGGDSLLDATPTGPRPVAGQTANGAYPTTR